MTGRASRLCIVVVGVFLVCVDCICVTVNSASEKKRKTGGEHRHERRRASKEAITSLGFDRSIDRFNVTYSFIAFLFFLSQGKHHDDSTL